MTKWETPDIYTRLIEDTEEGGSTFETIDKTWTDENDELVADYEGSES